VRAAASVNGRHPKTFTGSDIPTNSLPVITGNVLDKFDDSPPQFGVCDLCEGFGECQPIGRR
jgi:hypothetical protein